MLLAVFLLPREIGMKKFLLLFSALFVIIAPMTDAVGINKDEEQCDVFPEDFVNDNCERTKNVSVWIDNCLYRVPSCTKCYDGYAIETDMYADGVDGCVPGCDPFTCKSDTTWTAGNTGYQKKTNRSCNTNNDCIETTVYQCAGGYYGTPTNGTSGCTRCPTGNGVTGTSPAGTTVATGCYVTSGSDTGGSFTYTSNCFYSN